MASLKVYPFQSALAEGPTGVATTAPPQKQQIVEAIVLRALRVVSINSYGKLPSRCPNQLGGDTTTSLLPTITSVTADAARSTRMDAANIASEKMVGLDLMFFGSPLMIASLHSA